MIKHSKADLKNNFVQIELSQDDLLSCLFGVIDTATQTFPGFVNKNFTLEEKTEMHTQMSELSKSVHDEDYDSTDEEDYKKLIQKLTLIALNSLKS